MIADFDWDDGNWPKCGKHGLSKEDIEAVFRSGPRVFGDPSIEEQRKRAIGVNVNRASRFCRVHPSPEA